MRESGERRAENEVRRVESEGRRALILFSRTMGANLYVHGALIGLTLFALRPSLSALLLGALSYLCSSQTNIMGKIAINIATGSLQQKEAIVGIDLGTTNSLIAIVREDTRQPIALREVDGLTLVPSIVHFDTTGNVTVGSAAKEHLIAEPERTIYSVKRLMGKSYKDVKHDAGFFAYKVIDDDTDSLV